MGVSSYGPRSGELSRPSRCRVHPPFINFLAPRPLLSSNRMPTYEYRCPDGHDFERFFRKISDAPAEVAGSVCGKIAERRMSAGAGLVFKGSGFYLTDYGKNAHRKGGDAGSGSGESSGES